MLDCPCDLQSGEDVTVILNLHGAGSSERYQRPYFPAWELKEKYRLVVTAVLGAGGEDNVRLDKGRIEGLEPRIVETIVGMMTR